MHRKCFVALPSCFYDSCSWGSQISKRMAFTDHPSIWNRFRNVIYILWFCLRSILITEFDARNAPPSLQPLAWLIGIWRSEHGGKAIFPTIPKFTYGEQVEIAVSDSHMTGLKALNYSYVFIISFSEEEKISNT